MRRFILPLVAVALLAGISLAQSANPVAPTAPLGNNSTQIANTNWVWLNAATIVPPTPFINVDVVTSSPHTVTSGENGYTYTNTGATVGITFNLPAAPTDLIYHACVNDTDGITLTAGTGDTIRISDIVSASSGNVSSTTIGACITLVGLNSSQWFVSDMTNSWTVN